ncbi:MAG: hypothetical protein CVV10_08225 [Gammaproteobacteria bacterium HGW-Gammaproteobacteria-14]|nr:MAG: hypothetical protein CVV10_08225 [Gammaproteobacteria bacterium HGW-Gammaproteobacteria-14]
MTDHTTWVAFRSSEMLHRTTDGFIQRMRNGASRPEPETLDAIMSTFMKEVLHNFFIVPTEQANLPSSTQRIVQLAADTISKASHLVIKSTVKKLDIDQNKRAANYMDTVRFSINKDDETIWFVAFPLNDMMAAKGRKAFEQGINGEGKQAMPALLEYFHQLTDIGVYWYFEEPIKLLRFGPIMRKVADVGIATTRKATHSVIDKVIPAMNEEQLVIACQYARMQLVDGPKRDAV